MTTLGIKRGNIVARSWETALGEDYMTDDLRAFVAIEAVRMAIELTNDMDPKDHRLDDAFEGDVQDLKDGILELDRVRRGELVLGGTEIANRTLDGDMEFYYSASSDRTRVGTTVNPWPAEKHAPIYRPWTGEGHRQGPIGIITPQAFKAALMGNLFSAMSALLRNDYASAMDHAIEAHGHHAGYHMSCDRAEPIIERYGIEIAAVFEESLDRLEVAQVLCARAIEQYADATCYMARIKEMRRQLARIHGLAPTARSTTKVANAI